jgi:hypothetical protein
MLLFLHTCFRGITDKTATASLKDDPSLSLFSLWSQFNLCFISSDLSRLLSQTIRLPLFGLWPQFNPLCISSDLSEEDTWLNNTDISCKRSFSLSLVYGLRITYLYFFRSVLGRYLAKQHRHLSQTIRLPLFSLWSQFNFFVFLQTCLRTRTSLKDDPSPSL